MKPWRHARLLLRISDSQDIMRRYFVVNGFDGAVTMLGLVMGFIMSGHSDPNVIISACLGAAIALGVSGVSSAYVSESAERRRALEELEEAMVADLRDSAYGQAARLMPLLIALVNGLAPFMISLLIISPLWLARAGVVLPLSPLIAAVVIALVIIFLLGVFIGRVAGTSWFRSGLQTLLIAAVTMGLIYVFSGSGPSLQ